MVYFYSNLGQNKKQFQVTVSQNKKLVPLPPENQLWEPFHHTVMGQEDEGEYHSEDPSMLLLEASISVWCALERQSIKCLRSVDGSQVYKKLHTNLFQHYVTHALSKVCVCLLGEGGGGVLTGAANPV